VSQILYAIVQNISKVSILLLFLRIFPDKQFRFITKVCIGWMGCHTVAFGVAVSLQCVPPSALWDANTKGKCSNSTALVYSGAAFSIFEDLVIIALPVRELKGLNLSPRKKLAVIFMFALGSLYVSIPSFIYLWQCADLIQCLHNEHGTPEVHSGLYNPIPRRNM
jgi:hypothetical protein